MQRWLQPSWIFSQARVWPGKELQPPGMERQPPQAKGPPRPGLHGRMPGPNQDFGQARFFLVAQDRPDAGESSHFGRGPLGITAGDPDGGAGIIPGQAADGLAGLLVGPGR